MHVSGEKAEFDLGVLAEDTAHPYRLQCRQAILSKALADELPRDALHFGTLITEVFQDDKGGNPDENVTGTTQSNVQHLRASGSNVSLPAPTYTNQATLQ